MLSALIGWACAPPPSPGLEPLPGAAVEPVEPVEPVEAGAPTGPAPAPARSRRERPAPAPAEPLPDPARQVLIRIDAGLERVRGGTLECGAQKLKADRSHDTIVFDDVPGGSCRLTFRGDDLSGVVLAGTWWHLAQRESGTALVRE